jgi:hypothetical protein
VDNPYSPQATPNLIGLSSHPFASLSEFMSLLSSALSHVPYSNDIICNHFSTNPEKVNVQNETSGDVFGGIFANTTENSYDLSEELNGFTLCYCTFLFFCVFC